MKFARVPSYTYSLLEYVMVFGVREKTRANDLQIAYKKWIILLYVPREPLQSIPNIQLSANVLVGKRSPFIMFIEKFRHFQYQTVPLRFSPCKMTFARPVPLSSHSDRRFLYLPSFFTHIFYRDR